MSSLFESYDLAGQQLSNRIVMAPMTRARVKDTVPSADMANYYAQRAGAGLIITESAQVSAQGRGYLYTPGIHTPAQIEGWKRVTDAVHQAGGRIVIQLWHDLHASHLGTPEFQKAIRAAYCGTLLLSGGFNHLTAQQAIDDGLADLAVFGRPFIANPDLVDRLRHGWPLADAGREAFYGGGSQGYIDYPAYSSRDAQQA